MKNYFKYILVFLLYMALYACKKNNVLPSEDTQPLVFKSVGKDTVNVSGMTIYTGPIKDFEQESDVVYKLTVSSGPPLTKFIVTTTSDIFTGSHILQTEPADAIDVNGNFTQKLNEVVVYYAYHISEGIAPLKDITATFSFQNESNYVGLTTDAFRVIKKGSTAGHLLTVMDFPWARRDLWGIGNQENFDFVSESGSRPDNAQDGNNRPQHRRGPFFSLELQSDISFLDDALAAADKIDIVGFRARVPVAATDPVLVNNNIYLVSPSYEDVLNNAFVGASQGGLTLLGTDGSGEITSFGLTFPIVFQTDLNTTTANFVTENKAAFGEKGILLTNNGANILWNTALRGTFGDPPGFKNSGGTLMANPYFQPNENVISVRKELDFRRGIQQLKAVLQEKYGRGLRVTRFKRLDNLSGDGQVTAAYFDQLTHDNEFDTLLAGIETEGQLITDPIGFDQVYGFVTDNGKRGLIRTSPNSYIQPNGVLKAIPALNSANYVTYCSIKYQQTDGL